MRPPALQITLDSSFIKLSCERLRLEAKSHLLIEFQRKAIKHTHFIYLKISPWHRVVEHSKNTRHFTKKKNADYMRRDVTLLRSLTVIIHYFQRRQTCDTVQHNYTFSKIKIYFPVKISFFFFPHTFH